MSYLEAVQVMPSRRIWRALWKRALGAGFITAFFALIVSPSLRHAYPGKPAVATAENRRLAEPPAWPRTWGELSRFFAATDDWLNDHFGLREVMIAWNNRLRFSLLGEVSSPQVTLGSNGFLYFNSHDAAQPLSMIRFLCGVGLPADWPQQATERLAGVLRAVAAAHPASTLLIVPTKPAVYPEHLPEWLQAQCFRGRPPVPEIVTMLRNRADIRVPLAFPLDEMRQWKTMIEVYPKTNFHWHGEGARRVAAHLAQDQLHVGKLVELPRRPAAAQSDLQKFLPGVALDFSVEEPDYAAVGVSKCAGAACFPEFPTAAAKLADVSRYRHAARSGPRLLIISDSFGAYVAGEFAQYFGEVWHLSTNEIKQLTRDETLHLKDAAFERFAPDRVLYVFHDSAVATSLVNIQTLLAPTPVRSPAAKRAI